MHERRRHPRANVKVAIRTTDPTTPAPLQSVNLSESGIFLATDQPFPIGAVVGIELSGGRLAESLCLKARVVRVVDPGSPQEAGMGLEFVHVPPRELSRLRELVRGATGSAATVVVATQDDNMRTMICAVLAEQRHHVVVAQGS